jgi:hypothetical protein
MTSESVPVLSRPEEEGWHREYSRVVRLLDAERSRLASLRERIEGLPTALMGQPGKATPWVRRAAVLAEIDKEAGTDGA